MESKRQCISVFLFTIIISFFIILVCQISYKEFFFIDDAKNAFLGMVTEMGRQLHNGEIPIITTKTMLGGNFLVDIVFAPFCPQIFITALVTSFTESYYLPCLVFAFMNIFISIISGYYIGAYFTDKQSLRYLTGFLCATNPVFLFVYCASWWNLADAQSWFLASMAALLHFQRTSSASCWMLSIGSASILVASGGTQPIIAYLIFWAILVIFDFIQYKSYRKALLFILQGICTFLIVLPIFSEYIAVASMLARPSGFNNWGNFLSPSLGQMLFTMNPLYGDFMHWFGGYRYIPVQLAYTTIAILPAIFFYKNINIKNKNLLFISVLTVMYFICTQLPQQFGAIRYSFRFLPFFSLCLVIVFIILSDNAQIHKNKKITILYISTLFLFCLLSLFKIENLQYDNIFIVCCFMLILLFAPAMLFYFKNTNTAIFILSILGFFLIMAAGRSLAYNFLSNSKIIYEKNKNNEYLYNDSGYILSLAGSEPRDTVANYACTDFLRVGYRAINGYSPVGMNDFIKIFPYPTPHGAFELKTLDNIMQKEEKTSKYLYDLFNISTIVTYNNINDNYKKMLFDSGFINKSAYKNKYIYYTNKKIYGTVSFNSPGLTVKNVNKISEKKERFDITENASGGTIVFSRISWPGYTASLNGKFLPLRSIAGVLLSLEVPADATGTVELSYWPSTWRIALPLATIGLLFAFTIYVYLLRRRENICYENSFFPKGRE